MGYWVSVTVLRIRTSPALFLRGKINRHYELSPRSLPLRHLGFQPPTPSVARRVR